MKERPILFSGPMVRAIIAGTKTQTRRVFKPQPPVGSSLHQPELYAPVVIDRDGIEQPGVDIFGAYTEDGEWGVKCPYGRPGDRLWVRETFVKFDPSHWPPKFGYKADILGPGFEESEQARKDLGYKWRPSIFMPRAASRLTLDVLDIRVERVQEISYEDAVAEGIDHEYPKALVQFRELWDSINEKRGCGWKKNPFVWVVKFQKFGRAFITDPHGLLERLSS